jgi:type IV pilus assembly protein PilN
MAMMVRINLLPVRAVKKREAGRQIFILFAVIIAGVVAGNALWYSSRNSVYDRNQQQISATEAEISKLEKIIGEVNNISKRKKEVEEKLKVLDQLRRGRTGPVKLLDALATAVPKKVWLASYEEQGGQVKIKGNAISNDDLAEFMRGLDNIVWTPKGIGRLVEQKRDSKTSRVELVGAAGAIEDFNVDQVANFFTNVELKGASQKSISQQGTQATEKIVDFELALSANYQI